MSTPLLDETQTYTAGSDTIEHTTVENSKVFALGGNDTITITSTVNKNSLIDGGTGNDSFDIDTVEDSHIEGNAGNDKITVTTADGSNIYGGTGNDTITVTTAEGSRIDGGSGNNNITIETRLDPTSTIYAANGNDTISLETDSFHGTIHAGNGTNTITVEGVAYSYTNIYGGSGVDSITMGTASGHIYAGNGNNKITAETVSGDGHIYSGTGSDNIIVHGALHGKIDVGNGTNTIKVDSIVGDRNTYGSIYGGAHVDKVYIATSSDSAEINTAAGNDILDFRGADSVDVAIIAKNSDASSTINAGDGADKIYIDSVGDATMQGRVSINAGIGNDSISIETLNATAGSISVGGDDGNDSLTVANMHGGDLYGADGNDLITIDNMTGGTIYAGDNNDRINIKSEISGGTVRGGNGNDSFTITADISGGKFYGEAGNDSFTFSKSLGSGVTVNGGSGDDLFTLNAGMAGGSINGDDGNDRFILKASMTGGYIYGGSGDDVFTLNAVMNGGTLDGFAGDDTISLKGANGTLTKHVQVSGGADSDSITLNALTKGKLYEYVSVNGGTGNDIIKVNSIIQNGAVYGGADDDNITVTTAETGSQILGGSGHDEIKVINANAGSVIYGGADYFVSDVNHDVNVDGTTLGFISTQIADGHTLTKADITITIYNNGAWSFSSEIPAPLDVGFGIDYGYYNGESGNFDMLSFIIRAGETEASGNISLPVSPSGDDKITLSNATNASVFAGDGDDFVTISNLKAMDSGTIDLGDGNDTLVVTKRAAGMDGDDDTKLANIIINSDDNNSLEVSWAFDGKFAGDGHDESLSTNGIGANAELNFAGGNDALFINGTLDTSKFDASNVSMGDGNDSIHIAAKKGDVDDAVATTLLDQLGAGADTLSVGWAFNGDFDNTNGTVDPADDLDRTLITKGLGKDATYDFGVGNDGLHSTAAISGTSAAKKTFETFAGDDSIRFLSSNHVNIDAGADDDEVRIDKTASNGSINAGSGDDLVSISSTATNVQIDLGMGSDSFSVGAMGKNSTLTYDTGGADSITIKGTFNDGMVVNGLGEAMALSTGADGGAITLDTLGTGKLEFSNDSDTITINKALSGTATNIKEINTLAGYDEIYLNGTVKYAHINAGTDEDYVQIASLSTGSKLSYNVDGYDSIAVYGTFSDATTTSITTDASGVVLNTFYGLSTGEDGGRIWLDTWGSGNVQFGAGEDSLVVHKALSGSNGLKDVFTNAGDDSIVLNSVNGAIISGGDDDDFISALSLGTTGVLNGDAGNDLIQLGKDYTDEKAYAKATASMKSGVINGGDGVDTIIIGHTLGGDINDFRGTFSGGKVYAGSGNDNLATTTLSGSALMDGGDGNDLFYITNMSDGTIEGGAGNDSIEILGTFSRGTINAGDGNEEFIIEIMSGGTINADANDADIDIDTFKGGTINGGTGINDIDISNMSGGTINGGALSDDIYIDYTMSGGKINAGAGADTFYANTLSGRVIVNTDDGEDNIEIDTMTTATLNSGAGDDYIEITSSMNSGIINDGAGDDTINVTTMNGGTINSTDGNADVEIYRLNGGTINTGLGENTITISNELNGGKIVGGKGDDTLILGNNIKLGSGYSINLGSGEDQINVLSNLKAQTLTLGASHDSVYIENGVNSATINLGNGNNTLTNKSGAAFINSYILGGSGSDSVEIFGSFNQRSSINLGTGSDSIKMLGSFTTDQGAIAGTITYDNKGQDTLVLADYTKGTFLNSAGDVIDLSTGTDGGSISLNRWTSDDAILFGNGHDQFSLLFEDLTNTIDLMSGNDKVSVNGIDSVNGGAISYNNKGLDSIIINGEYDGTGITSTSTGKDSFALSTGTDGGYIELDEITSTNASALSFGNGKDTLVINELDATGEEVKLLNGADKLEVTTLTNGTISYNNDGFDSIIIKGQYAGTGIEDQDGNLSTGAAGGHIHVGSFVDASAASKLSFSDSNDSFSIDSMAFGDINLGKGADTITVNTELTAGTITYDADGYDSISIAGAYDEAFISLATGAGGGYIHVDSFVDADAVNAVKFDKFNDTLSIKDMDKDGTLDLLAGNDKINVSGELIDGTINAGDGKNIITVNRSHGASLADASNAKIISGKDADIINLGFTRGLTVNTNAGNDSINITTVLGNDINTINAGAGNDKFVISSSVSSGAVLEGDTGNDNFTIERMSGGRVYGEKSGDDTTVGNDIFNIATITGGNVYGNAGNEKITIVNMAGGNVDAGIGNDSFILTTVTNGQALGGLGVDKFNITQMSGGDINGDAGKDSLTVTHMTGGNVTGGLDNDSIIVTNMAGGAVFGDAGSDVFKSTNMTGGSVNLGADADTLTITNFEGGSALGDSGVDKFTITNMSGDDSVTILNGGGDNDIISLTKMNGGFVTGGGDNDKITIKTAILENSNAIEITGDTGNDTISVTTAENASIYGGSGNDVMTITTARTSIVGGGADNDSIKITTAMDSDILGNGGSDSLTLTTVNRVYIAGGGSEDNISVTTAYDSLILGGDENDTITVKTLSDHSVVNGSGDHDKINITTATDSKVYGDDAYSIYNVDAEVGVTIGSSSPVDISFTKSIGENGEIILSIDEVIITIYKDGYAEINAVATPPSQTYFEINYSIIDSLGNIDDTRSEVFVVESGTAPGTIIVPNDDLLTGGSVGNDVINITTATRSEIFGGAGSDTINITTLNAGNHIDLGSGNDSLSIMNNKSGLDDTELAKLVSHSIGTDTLNVNWAFNGIFKSTGEDGDVLSTKGLGKDAELYFDAGKAEGLIINGALSSIKNEDFNSEAELEAALTAGGNDTLGVGWAFNSEFTAHADGSTLITKGLGKNAELNFTNTGNDGLYITGAASGIKVSQYKDDSALADAVGLGGSSNAGGNDTLSVDWAFNGTFKAHDDITSSATLISNGIGKNADLTFGAGRDALIVNGSITTYEAGTISMLDGSDTLKVSTTLGVSVDMGDGINNVEVGTLSTTGKIVSGAQTDYITVGSVAGEINTGAEGDDIFAKSLSSTGLINGDAGNDTIWINTMLGNTKGEAATINGGDGVDRITVDNMYGGIIDGGAEDDIITVLNSKLSAAKGVEIAGEIRGGAGDDTFIVNTIGAGFAKIDGGEGTDALRFESLEGALTIGAASDYISNVELYEFEDITSSKAEITITDGTAISVLDTMSAGSITGSDAADKITINDGSGDGTMSGGIINTLGGNDTVSIAALQGTALVNTDAGDDSIIIETAYSGIVSAGDGNDTIEITYMGSDLAGVSVIDAGAGNDSITVQNFNFDDLYTGTGENTVDIEIMYGGTLHGGADKDTVTITTMAGGMLNSDAGADSITITTLNGGTVNTGEGNDGIYIMSAGAASSIFGGADNDDIRIGQFFFNDKAGFDAAVASQFAGNVDGGDGSDTITIGDRVEYSGDILRKGDLLNGSNINGGAGNDSIDIGNMLGGTIDAGDDNDIIRLLSKSAGTINAGAGNDDIVIREELTGSGNIMGGAGNDTVALVGMQMDDGLSGVYGEAGEDLIRVAGNHTTGTLDGGADNDTIIVTGETNGNINGGDGNDKIDLNVLKDGIVSGNDGDDTIEVTTEMSGVLGYIHGDDGDDSITIADMQAGTIQGGDGSDTIKISQYTAGTIDAGAGDDHIYTDTNIATEDLQGGSGYDILYYDNITGIVSAELPARQSGIEEVRYVSMGTGGQIEGTDTADTVTLNSMTDGTINGLVGGDRITVTDMSGGTINGGDDNDSITITNMIDGIINGGEGFDFFTVDNATQGTLVGFSGEDNFSVVLNTNVKGAVTITSGAGESDTIRLFKEDGMGDVSVTITDFEHAEGIEDSVYFNNQNITSHLKAAYEADPTGSFYDAVSGFTIYFS